MTELLIYLVYLLWLTIFFAAGFYLGHRRGRKVGYEAVLRYLGRFDKK